jgi:adenylate cyclase
LNEKGEQHRFSGSRFNGWKNMKKQQFEDIQTTPEPWNLIVTKNEQNTMLSLHQIPHKKRMLLGLGASLVISLAVCAVLFSIPQINVLEWRLADVWAQGAYGKTVSHEVAVVGIDDAFLGEHGWPLEKDLYGDCIGYLTEMGVRVVAFDVLFADNLDACGKGDSLFREIVDLSPAVVLSCAAIMDDGSGEKKAGKPRPLPARYAIGKDQAWGPRIPGAILPYPALLEKAGHLGFLNQAIPFADGISRNIPVFAVQDSLVFPSLALKSAMLYSKQDSIVLSAKNRTVTLNGKTLKLDREGYLYVNFTDSIPVYTMTDIRLSHRQWLLGKKPKIGREQLADRIVFIGNTALSLGDFGLTPLSVREPTGRSPCVLMHARSAAALVSGSTVLNHGRPVALVISVFLVAALAVLYFMLPAQMAFFCGLLLGATGIIAHRYCYLHGHFVPLLEGASCAILFCILGTLAVYLEKELNRKYLYTIFGRYLSPKIIEEMYKKQQKPVLGGEEVLATAFFSDIENFSTFSEALSPGALIKSLNEYFEIMTRTLLDCSGTLDKYIGDAIVAFFGAPCRSTTHAYDACRAAVAMQEALAQLRLKWQQNTQVHESVKNLKMRIGINTGRFVTGNIGCSIRMNYTMIGDTVNVASRLESAAKQYGVYTVVGEETYSAAKEYFHFRRLDYIRVKGRKQPVAIYQLMGTHREHDEWIEKLIGAYGNALDSYVNGNFSKALSMFEQSRVLERYAESKNPSGIMRERCAYLIKNPPETWDGVFTMTTK